MTTHATRPYAAAAYDLGRVTLRAITGVDADALGPALAAIDPWRRANFPAAALTGYLTRPDPAASRFAIDAEGALAGVVAVREPWLRGPYLELLGLLPPAQGQGIGAAVLDWFEAEAPAGASSLWVLCSDFNTGALAFYERHGFQRVTLLDGLVGAGLTEILMRKRLGRR
jgi:GNAT superfamily N-acetyltransferase